MTEPVPLLRPATVLLAEDNEGDVILTREAFRQSRLLVDLHVVDNGRDCLDFLRRQGSHADAPRPDLLLLDLKMPVMSGHDVLAALMADDELREIPVVVLSTASQFEEVRQVYRLKANSFVRKPIDFHAFVDVVRELGHYWFTLVVLPTPPPPDGGSAPPPSANE